MNGDCEVGDRVIYHDPTPLHGVFHAVVTRRVTMPSGTVRIELDLEDPRPGDPPFRFATGREVHLAVRALHALHDRHQRRRQPLRSLLTPWA